MIERDELGLSFPLGPSSKTLVHRPLRKEINMALQKGERYRCPDQECGCEIEVAKGAAPGKGGNMAPRCCCGKEMQEVN
jgi:hypothetical protein